MHDCAPYIMLSLRLSLTNVIAVCDNFNHANLLPQTQPVMRPDHTPYIILLLLLSLTNVIDVPNKVNHRNRQHQT